MQRREAELVVFVDELQQSGDFRAETLSYLSILISDGSRVIFSATLSFAPNRVRRVPREIFEWMQQGM
jgi:hypothetical protein